MSFFLKKSAKVRRNSFRMPPELRSSAGASLSGAGRKNLW